MFADEGATLYSAHLSWSNLWAQSLHVDLVMLPYYVLVHFWLMLSGSIAWVRALSLFAFFGTIVAAGGLGLRIAGRWCGIIAAVLTATSTLLILKALNARPYELSALLVALCAVSLFKWLDDSRTRWLWAFSLLAILATATQLFALLAPASMLICVLAVRPRLLAQRLRALLGTHCSPCRGLRGLDCRKHRRSGPGELDRTGIGWKPTDCRAPRSCSRSGIRPRHVCHRGPGCRQTCRHLESGRPPCRRRTDQSRPGHLCAHHRMGRSFPRWPCQSPRSPIPSMPIGTSLASAPGAALLVAFVCVRVFPATLDPARSFR